MTRGTIELARRLCVEIAGPADEGDDTGRDYGSVDVAEILSAEVERLRELIDEVPHHEDCGAAGLAGGYYVNKYCDCFKSKVVPK